MNLHYGEVIEIAEEEGMRMGIVRVGGAPKESAARSPDGRRCPVISFNLRRDGDQQGRRDRRTRKKKMCLAIPGKLIEISTDANGVRMGKANFGGIVKQVCLEYTPEVGMGDYVLVHVGFALSKVDEEEAARTYKALEQMQQLGELDTPDVTDDEDPFPDESPPGSISRAA